MLNLQIPTGLIESMSPSELGAYMRGVREQFGLSLQDVADRIHVRVKYLEAIESADWQVMPAKVYARGYLQNYAEFLGLDPKKVIAICLETDVPKEPAAATPKPAARVEPVEQFAHWRAVITLVTLLAFGLLIFAQLREHGASDLKETVPQVPEQMLAATRTMAMPTAENYACFSDSDSWMACLFSSREWQMLSDTEVQPSWSDASTPVEPQEVAVDAPNPVEIVAEEKEELVTPLPEKKPEPTAKKADKPKPEPAKEKQKPAAKKEKSESKQNRSTRDSNPEPYVDPNAIW